MGVGSSLSGNCVHCRISSEYWDNDCLHHHQSNFMDTDNDRIDVTNCHGLKSERWNLKFGKIKNYYYDLCLEPYSGWKWFLKNEVFAERCDSQKNSQRWTWSN